MKPAKIQDVAPRQLDTPLDHKLHERRPTRFDRSETFALLTVRPAGGEGPTRQVRFKGHYSGGRYAVTVNNTFHEVVWYAEDPEQLWEGWQAWLAEHGAAIVADLALDREFARGRTHFCKPRPKQLSFL